MSAGPLAGIRILEVGVMLAGPYATMLLADLGAEVIKIEPPGGEISRQVSDSYFASLNRNKQSVRLDLRSEAGRRQLGELVSKSACAAGQYEAVGDSPARTDLRRAAAVQRTDRLRGLDGFRAERGRRSGIRLRDPGGDRGGGDDRRSRRPADLARLFGSRQLHRPGRGARSAGPDRVGSRRAGRCLAARCDDVAVELPRLGVSQRRSRAAAPSVRGTFVLRSGAAVLDGRRLPRALHHP